MSENWKTYKLGELLVSKNQGVNTTTEKVKYSESGIKVIRAKNISDYKIDFEDITYVNEGTFERVRSNCKPLKGDILYTNIGSQMGSAVIVPTTQEFMIAWNVLRMTPDKEKVDCTFLAYLFNENSKKTYIRNLNSSSTMPFVSGKVLEKVEFKIPELNEQKAIASILSALDEKIELNLQMNKTLESMAMALYKHWFVDFGPFGDGEFVDSELGEIPKGWEVKKLSSLANFKNGKGLKKEFKKEDGKNNVFGSNGVIGKTDEYTFDKPVIAIGRVGANYGEVHYSIYKCWISDNAVTAQPLNQKYFWWLLQRLRLIDYSNFVAGSAQPLITQGAIKDVNCVVPNEDLLNDFSSRLGFLFSQLQNNLLENKTLTKLRDTLLPKLISGEVRVKDIASTITEEL